MHIKDYEDLSKVTIADFHVAIYNSEEQMKNCLKNKNIKGFLQALKFNLRLKKFLDKKARIHGKENNVTEKQL